MTTPELVTIYLSSSNRSSGGNGPGPVQVPADEAAWWVGQSLAVYGEHPPAGLYGPFFNVVTQQ